MGWRRKVGFECVCGLSTEAPDWVNQVQNRWFVFTYGRSIVRCWHGRLVAHIDSYNFGRLGVSRKHRPPYGLSRLTRSPLEMSAIVEIVSGEKFSFLNRGLEQAGLFHKIQGFPEIFLDIGPDV